MTHRRRAALISLGIAVFASCALAGGRATAQDNGGGDDACLSAPLDGQKLQKEGKLLEARDRFALCGRATCPSVVVQSCVRWKAEVDAAVPSVVLTARDAQGHDVGDAVVAIDGRSPVPIGTLAVSLNPGSHKFVFTRPSGGAPVEREAVLHEGEKNHEVAAEFPGSQQSSAPAPSSPSSEASRPVPWLAWALGAVGVAAVGTFATFGALGLSERSSDNCANGCSPTQYNDVTTKLRVADVSLAIAVVALAGATWVYLARPTVEKPSAAWLDVRAVSGGGAVGVAGSF